MARSISDRIALLSFAVIDMSMMSLVKALSLFRSEKPFVTRERMRRQYTGLEYLISKALAELPLDSLFSVIFAGILKCTTGLRCSYQTLIQTFTLILVGSASLGDAIRSFSHDKESALFMGVPILVVFMSINVINPSGVDIINEPPPAFLHWLKRASPIKWAIEALCISEFKGMEFAKIRKWNFD